MRLLTEFGTLANSCLMQVREVFCSFSNYNRSFLCKSCLNCFKIEQNSTHRHLGFGDVIHLDMKVFDFQLHGLSCFNRSCAGKLGLLQLNHTEHKNTSTIYQSTKAHSLCFFVLHFPPSTRRTITLQAIELYTNPQHFYMVVQMNKK